MNLRLAVLGAAIVLTGCRVELDDARIRDDFALRHRGCELLGSERRQPDEATIEIEHAFRCGASTEERRVVAHYTYHDGTWALWQETQVGAAKAAKPE